jgi:hypothetical protein
MSYNVGHKIIIQDQIFKITEVLSDNHLLYKACNEEGCMRIFLGSAVDLTYIGEADPEFYYSAKIMQENAYKLKNNIMKLGLCINDFCDKIDTIIELTNEIMNKFKYKK